MNFFLRLLIIIAFLFVYSCSKEKTKVSIIQEKEINLQMIDAYKEGVKAFEEGDVLVAARKFNEAAPDMVVRDHPNSVSNSGKNTP